jgi:hypothetical protein
MTEDHNNHPSQNSYQNLAFYFRHNVVNRPAMEREELDNLQHSTQQMIKEHETLELEEDSLG